MTYTAPKDAVCGNGYLAALIFEQHPQLRRVRPPRRGGNLAVMTIDSIYSICYCAFAESAVAAGVLDEHDAY